MAQQRCIKVPSSLYKKANDSKILNDVVFYYQLKCIADQHGYFDNSTIAKVISQRLKIASSSVWRKINNCIDNGLIIRYSNGYRLISYNALFELLGYDMTYDPRRNRKGSFKIHKIFNYNPKTIKYIFAFIDIRDNLKSQMCSALKNLRKDSRYAVPKLHCGTKKQQLEFLSSNTVHTTNLNDETIYLQQLAEASGKRSVDLCNPDITLSLQGICRVLGVSSTQTAFNIVKNLKALDLLTSLNRLVFVKFTTVKFEDFYKHFDRRYYQLGPQGCVLRRISNKITVTGVL